MINIFVHCDFLCIFCVGAFMFWQGFCVKRERKHLDYVSAFSETISEKIFPPFSPDKPMLLHPSGEVWLFSEFIVLVKKKKKTENRRKNRSKHRQKPTEPKFTQ